MRVLKLSFKIVLLLVHFFQFFLLLYFLHCRFSVVLIN